MLLFKDNFLQLFFGYISKLYKKLYFMKQLEKRPLNASNSKSFA